jgi:5-methylcytosine-specific restriction endonuclease McrBC GTP-binding regulatory subunit McrB
MNPYLYLVDTALIDNGIHYMELLTDFDSASAEFIQQQESSLGELFLKAYQRIRNEFPNCDCYINFMPESGYRQLCFGIKEPEKKRGKPVFFMDITKGRLNFWRNETLFNETRNYIQLEPSFTELNSYLANSSHLLADVELRMTGSGLAPINARVSNFAVNQCLRIWKVSHSPSVLSAEHREWLANNNFVTVHKDTGNGSMSCFEQMAVGDVISLGYGNTVFKIVEVTSEIITVPDSPLSDEWLLRRYKEVKSLAEPVDYKGEHKRWSPRFPGTCWEVPKNEFLFFEQEILKPYFNLDLSIFGLDIPQGHNTIGKSLMTDVPLNQILYGPPGTGKTYSTINKAFEIIEPKFLAENKDNRKALKVRFDKLVKANRIAFVTFHQSFSYEDFVEGIKASTNDNNQVSYDVEDGIFKSLCERASSSVGGVVAADSFDEAVKLLQEECEMADERIEMKTVRGKVFEIEFSGGSTFKVFPRSTESTDPKYVASIANVRKLYLTGSKDGIYNSSYVEGFLLYLKEHLGVADPENSAFTNSVEEQPFVLIIDEINRGNIASIFGELITLIEPSKRSGGDETITVKLPYSKTPFSVPSNLYLVGTMNTADKSLAQVDIALRRRFEFIEMMTNYDVLEDIPEINGVNIKRLVETINQRIELLYDREHTIGHSFFLPLKDEPTIEKLSSVFELQILPLLEEYFFEDWERVGQVLGDHLKPNNDLRFIIEKFSSSDMSKLMGDEWELSGIQPYVRNDAALSNPQAYIGVYESAH